MLTWIKMLTWTGWVVSPTCKLSLHSLSPLGRSSPLAHAMPTDRTDAHPRRPAVGWTSARQSPCQPPPQATKSRTLPRPSSIHMPTVVFPAMGVRRGLLSKAPQFLLAGGRNDSSWLVLAGSGGSTPQSCAARPPCSTVRMS